MPAAFSYSCNARRLIVKRTIEVRRLRLPGFGRQSVRYSGGILPCPQVLALPCRYALLGVRARAEVRSFPSARFYGTTVYGKDKCGTKEKARPCSDWQGRSSRRAVAPLRARCD